MFKFLQDLINDYRQLGRSSKIAVWVLASLPRAIVILIAVGLIVWAAMEYGQR